MNTAAGCGWTSSGVPAWITGYQPAGRAPTTDQFHGRRQHRRHSHSANIIIGGQTFAVTQAGRGRVQLLAEPDQPQPAVAAGGSSSFDVNTTAGCSWTSSGVPAWITGVPASGTGTTTINFTVAANPDPAPRSANIIIGGQTFSVTQAPRPRAAIR